MMDLVIGVLVLSLGFVGFCALFAWLSKHPSPRRLWAFAIARGTRLMSTEWSCTGYVLRDGDSVCAMLRACSFLNALYRWAHYGLLGHPHLTCVFPLR
jgi:hypothetical protein